MERERVRGRALPLPSLPPHDPLPLSLSLLSPKQVFVLFGSAWCTHCHDLLQAFDAARVQHGTAAGSGAPAQQQQQSGRWRLPWARPGFWFRGGGQEPTPTPSLPSPASSAPRFVAATVDFMGEAALDVRLTPTVAVYRRGARLDAWAGADGGKLADRVWLWAGARRGGVAGEVVVRK